MIKLNGQSIIETVIAAGLISIAILAALGLATRSESQSSSAKTQAEATKYATQAIDWLRGERATLGWTAITSANNNTYCLSTIPANFNSLPASGSCSDTDLIDNTFERELVFNSTPAELSSGVLKVSVTVSWTEKTTRHTTLELELTQWN